VSASEGRRERAQQAPEARAAKRSRADSARYDVAGTGSMVVDEIHLAKRIVAAEEKGLLRADASGNVVQYVAV